MANVTPPAQLIGYDFIEQDGYINNSKILSFIYKNNNFYLTKPNICKASEIAFFLTQNEASTEPDYFMTKDGEYFGVRIRENNFKTISSDGYQLYSADLYNLLAQD